MSRMQFKIPRFIPHTKPTPTDHSDLTGPVFFQIRTIPTSPDHSDRMHPPQKPSVAGSIPTGPADSSFCVRVGSINLFRDFVRVSFYVEATQSCDWFRIPRIDDR
jgi:hypothetical protein